MNQLPREQAFDSTLSFILEGYEFIPRRCQLLQTDAFETRILFQKVVCAFGEEAAELFFEKDRFTRKGATPPTALTLLQDVGSVQLLDGAAHRVRKQMFLSLMTREKIQELVNLVVALARHRAEEWCLHSYVILQEEVEEILCDAVCKWVGLELNRAELKERTREFSAMIEGAGSIGPRNWRGQYLRSRTEEWACEVIAKVRAGEIRVKHGSALEVIATHCDENGVELDEEIAAVELINVLRPTVAVARYVTFGAVALFEHPECMRRLKSDPNYFELFAQEVRRYFPFFPAVGGRARYQFEWRGRTFAKGDWMLFDVYGTSHDPRIWRDPRVFRPERFLEWNGSPFNFVPQGGGDYLDGHRCAGEWLTIELTKVFVHFLVNDIAYDVPKQDLRIPLSRMPAIPNSRFVMRNVRLLRRDLNDGRRSVMPPVKRPDISVVAQPH